MANYEGWTQEPESRTAAWQARILARVESEIVDLVGEVAKSTHLSDAVKNRAFQHMGTQEFYDGYLREAMKEEDA